MKEKIDQMIRNLDAETRERAGRGVLWLMGPEDSEYLRAVQRKAAQLGVATAFSQRVGQRVTVIDTERVKRTGNYLREWYDPDCIYHGGMSCAAEAAFRIILAADMPEANVAIIGRGHSVQSLFELLQEFDYTPLPCHSHTKSVARVTEAADIIVDGATEAVECCLSGRLIIDTAGKLAEAAEHTRVLCVARGERPPVYVSRHEVARLNISLLLNRAAMFLDGRKPKLL